MIIDLEPLKRAVDERFITCRPHPENDDLVIWNYTNKCLYDGAWRDNSTMIARGLITKRDGTLVARCMTKFFNYEEYKFDLPDEPYTVTEKMDGSMGVLYFLNNVPYIATRGSFESEQAIHATKILREKYSDYDFDPDYTYIFEIVYPENRVIVDYGDMDDLVLITVIHTETGDEVDIRLYDYPFPTVKYYDMFDYEQIQQMSAENREGVVLRYASGLRVKVKMAEYKRMAAILSNCSSRLIWEYLKTGQPLEELYSNMPDEIYKWIKSVSQSLQMKYMMLYKNAKKMYKDITDAAQVETTFPTNGILKMKDFKRLRMEMSRYLDKKFREYPEMFDLLQILNNLDGDISSSTRTKMYDAKVWDMVYPELTYPAMLHDETTN
jgi:RNA ligase